MAEQKFALFVSAVAGHLVARPNSDGREYFGALVSSPDDRAKGAESVVWDEQRVIPILPADAARFVREFARHFRSGALKKRTEEEWEIWQGIETKREDKRDADREEAAKKAAEAKVALDKKIAEEKAAKAAKAAEESKAK